MGGILAAIGLSGALNASLLAAATMSTRRAPVVHRWLAAMLGCLAAAMLAILVSHATDGSVRTIAVMFENILTACAGPVLYLYVCAAIGVRPIFGITPHFIPAAAYAVPMLGAGLLGDAWFLPIKYLVAHQVLYTALAAATVVRTSRNERPPLLVALVLATMAGIHVAQGLRFARIDIGKDIVPAVAALGVAALVLAMLRVTSQQAKPAARYAKSGLDQDASADIHLRATAAIEAQRLYRNSKLSLADVAALVGVPSHHVSQAFSLVGQESFARYLARLRFAEAQRLLLAPQNATVAVEALGLEAGFGSRAAFYKAFSDELGMSPAAFRTKAAGNHVQAARRGQD